MDGVHHDQGVPPLHVECHVVARRAGVDEGDGVGEFVGRIEHPDHVRPEGVVVHEDVPDSQNGNAPRPGNSRTGGRLCGSVFPARHSTLTREISFPSVSTVWMAQARHGSKEWMVRSTSSGRLGSAMGLPISDASYGPICPFASRGPAFHVEGTTAW